MAETPFTRRVRHDPVLFRKRIRILLFLRSVKSRRIAFFLGTDARTDGITDPFGGVLYDADKYAFARSALGQSDRRYADPAESNAVRMGVSVPLPVFTAWIIPQRDIHIRELAVIARNLFHMDFVDRVAGIGIAFIKHVGKTIPDVTTWG